MGYHKVHKQRKTKKYRLHTKWSWRGYFVENPRSVVTVIICLHLWSFVYPTLSRRRGLYPILRSTCLYAFLLQSSVAQEGPDISHKICILYYQVANMICRQLGLTHFRHILAQSLASYRKGFGVSVWQSGHQLLALPKDHSVYVSGQRST